MESQLHKLSLSPVVVKADLYAFGIIQGEVVRSSPMFNIVQFSDPRLNVFWRGDDICIVSVFAKYVI